MLQKKNLVENSYTQKVSSNEQDGGIAIVCSVSQDFLAHGN